MTMLVFRFKDAPAVLTAMKRELTLAHGFRVQNLTPRSAAPPYEGDVAWQFVPALDYGDSGDGARFLSGYAAADAEGMYELDRWRENAVLRGPDQPRREMTNQSIWAMMLSPNSEHLISVAP